MRWVFFSLIGLNVVLLFWVLFFRDAAPVDLVDNAAVSAYENVDTIKLVDIEPPVKSRAPAESTVNQSPSRQLCEMVGPFSGLESAQEFLQRLLAIDIEATTREIELPVGSRYWVILRPLPSRKDALKKLQELQSKGIDSYFIPSGVLENGISLGVFANEDIANEHFERVKSLNLEAYVEKRVHKSKETWVVLGVGQDDKMSEITWGRVLEGVKNANRRQNLCLNVASEGNFQ